MCRKPCKPAWPAGVGARLVLTRKALTPHTPHPTRRCESEAAHAEIAAALWDSASDSDAISALRRLAADKLAGWEEEVRGAGGGRGDMSRGGGGGVGGGRDRRKEDEEY